MQAKFGVTPADRQSVEASLLRDMRKEKVRGTVMVVDGDERSLLEITQKLRAYSFGIIAASTIA